MTLLADFNQYVSDTEASSLYGSWARSNPVEAAKWRTYRSAIQAGRLPPPPVMATLTGKSYVDVGVLYLDATAPAPPPPVTTSYAQATAGIVLPAFTPTTPVITCHSQADIDAQIAALQTLPAAEYRKIVVAPGVTYSGELTWSLPNLPGGPGLNDPHVFWDWGPSFKLTANAPAGFYGRDFNNVLMAGGDFTNQGGPGIFIARGHGFQWIGFSSHDCAADGLDVTPGFDKIGAFMLKGILTHNGLVITGDPHSEKGTGIHACNASDGGHDFGDPVVRSTLALQILQQPTGAGVELGCDSPLIIQNVDLYLYADTIGLPLSQPSSPGPTWLGYAQSQVAGNLLQLWGSCAFKGIDVKYAEGHNLQGRVIDTNGVESTNPIDVTVEYGRAVACCLSAPKANSSLGRQTSPTNPWDPRHGVTYVDVA